MQFFEQKNEKTIIESQWTHITDHLTQKWLYLNLKEKIKELLHEPPFSVLPHVTILRFAPPPYILKIMYLCLARMDACLMLKVIV